MNILYVCHRFPFPPKRGGKIRPFNMIRHLRSAGHQVTVCSLVRSEAEAEEGLGIAPFCTAFDVWGPRALGNNDDGGKFAAHHGVFNRIPGQSSTKDSDPTRTSSLPSPLTRSDAEAASSTRESEKPC